MFTSMKTFCAGRAMPLLIAAGLIMVPAAGSAAAAEAPLWFSVAPPQKHDAGTHAKARAGHGQGHGGHESEHRPKPMRTYWLNTCDISPDARAYLMQPEGEYQAVPVKKVDHEVSVSVKTPFGEGPFHGANNVYLIDQKVQDGTLHVRSAKWLTIHHSCGWGHEHKFNEKRLHPQSLAEVPLEIVVDDLWDFNFHSTVMSGDTIRLKVFSYGEPVLGARVRAVSDQGWVKELKTGPDGSASFQMIRDYYPVKWGAFNRTKRGTLKFIADYEGIASGELNGTPYERVKMNSTYSWRYYPARQEYASYAYGLGTATLFLGIGGLGVFIYRDRRKKPYREPYLDE